ncbi:MAG: thioredoxin family protein [Candidatus Methanomethylophilaceae archaeon]|nr:thioredoxin family protein [Candidatus Methanomethylophilaceae archaeon]MDD3378429.1 thioredoxin family protein [Candidatus Methanomethylophilaceae archaeon]MDY0224535.1 thioredoxin family protein [Candidatus Methanomethylophilaceae archaeon]
MGLFKKENKEDKKEQASENEAYLKVLGGGCAKCSELEANAKKALEQLGMPIEIQHVRDMRDIASYGVMLTPALVLGKKAFSPGKILSVDEIVELLNKNKKE